VFGQSVGTTSLAGLADDPRFAQVGGLGGLPPLTPTQPTAVPFTPYLIDGTTNQFGGLINNQTEFAIDPHYKTPYNETVTFGIQRELPGNFLFETTYVGRFGHRLLSRGDAGQVVNFIDPASGEGLVPEFTKLSLQARNGQPLTQSAFFENLMAPTVAANYGTDCPGLASEPGIPDRVVPNCTTLI